MCLCAKEFRQAFACTRMREKTRGKGGNHASDTFTRRARAHTYTYTYTHTHVHVHTHTYTHVHDHTHTYIRTQTLLTNYSHSLTTSRTETQDTFCIEASARCSTALSSFATSRITCSITLFKRTGSASCKSQATEIRKTSAPLCVH